MDKPFAPGPGISVVAVGVQAVDAQPSTDPDHLAFEFSDPLTRRGSTLGLDTEMIAYQARKQLSVALGLVEEASFKIGFDAACLGDPPCWPVAMGASLLTFTGAGSGSRCGSVAARYEISGRSGSRVFRLPEAVRAAPRPVRRSYHSGVSKRDPASLVATNGDLTHLAVSVGSELGLGTVSAVDNPPNHVGGFLAERDHERSTNIAQFGTQPIALGLDGEADESGRCWPRRQRPLVGAEFRCDGSEALRDRFALAARPMLGEEGRNDIGERDAIG